MHVINEGKRDAINAINHSHVIKKRNLQFPLGITVLLSAAVFGWSKDLN